MTELAVDLLGADRPEEELCRGALAALEKDQDLFLHLFGHRAVIDTVLGENPSAAGRYRAVEAPFEITNLLSPTDAMAHTDASLVQALYLCRDSEKVAGIVTCGATGSMLMGSVMVLGRVGRQRPALLVELKNRKDESVCLLDCGANIDCRAPMLVDFAKLGDAYMRAAGCENPRVALLSNGAEKTKGCATVKEAHALLEKETLNFVGNVEPNHVLSGSADVVVCDGFHGNILLKCIEGTAKEVLAEIEANLPHADAETARVLQHVYGRYDYNTAGGAVLMGVKKQVMKGHGAATAKTVENMIALSAKLARNHLLERVKNV